MKTNIDKLRWSFGDSFVPADAELISASEVEWNSEELEKYLALALECYCVAPIDFVYTLCRRIYFNEMGFYPDDESSLDENDLQIVDITQSLIGKLVCWHSRNSWLANGCFPSVK